jgi:2-polyprenyl-3-methyl-5-hydroxy-6-metoxy-1,4-benzoquinol methylase
MQDSLSHFGVDIRRVAYGLYRSCPNLFVRKLKLSKLLVGGVNRYSAATHARLTGDLRRPSTPVAASAHAEFLRAYREIGDAIFQPEQFAATSYYKWALECIELYGRYFSHTDAQDIVHKAKSFARMFDGERSGTHDRHESREGAAVEVRRIKFSDCHEIVDGHHRLSIAVVRGLDEYPCCILPTEGALTPMQELVMDCEWMFGKRSLFQPISAPELESWSVVRKCTDRLEMMLAWLARNGISSGSFLDIGSSYGWFVSEMSKRGFQAIGIDRDAALCTVGHLAYGIEQSANVVADATTFLRSCTRQYDVVCCLSILHHFVLGAETISAAEFIQLVDKITASVLFLETGECHERGLKRSLGGWSADYIRGWLRDHTSFSTIEILGTDGDSDGPLQGRHSRHLFACSRTG